MLPVDLTRPAQIEEVAARILEETRPVDVVINNAGRGVAGRFADTPLDEHLDQLELDVTAVLRLTHAAAVAMTARGRGGILNVASLGGLAPAPRFASYAAGKAFVVSLTEALHEELRTTGVHVACACPGATRTEFGASSGATGDDLPGVRVADRSRGGPRGARRPGPQPGGVRDRDPQPGHGRRHPPASPRGRATGLRGGGRAALSRPLAGVSP